MVQVYSSICLTLVSLYMKKYSFILQKRLFAFLETRTLAWMFDFTKKSLGGIYRRLFRSDSILTSSSCEEQETALV